MAREHKLIDGGREVTIECSGSTDCRLCMKERDASLRAYANSIPYPAKYKKVRVKKKNGKVVIKRRLIFEEGIPEEIIGKTIKYICGVWCNVKYAPCWRCIKRKCTEWQKHSEFKGREPGCPHQIDTYCLDFTCKKGLIMPPRKSQ